MEEEYNKLRGMSLHETVEMKGFTIMRVPNGWIYTIHYNERTVFVPEKLT